MVVRGYNLTAQVRIYGGGDRPSFELFFLGGELKGRRINVFK